MSTLTKFAARLLLALLLTFAGAVSAEGQTEGGVSTASLSLVGVEYSNAYSEGLELYDRKDYHKAAEAFLRAARLNPQDADAYYNAGVALNQLNRLQEAVVAYRRTVSLRPDHAKAQNNLCYTLVRRGRNWEALEACKQSIRLSPGNPSPYYQLGLAHAALGRHEGAVIVFDLAIKLRPDFRDAQYHAGLSLRAMGDYKSALEVFARLNRAAGPAGTEVGEAIRETLQQMDRALRDAEPETTPASLLENVADAYRVAGRHADSVALYRRLLRWAPRDPSLHNKLGLALYSLNDYAAAAESLRRAVALTPDSAEAVYNLSWVYYVMGDMAAVVNTFKILSGSNQEAANRLLNNIGDEDLRRRLLRLGGSPAVSTASRMGDKK
ncbi:MAG TPA: tetratricopeptide repeat protein [Pyrinomonadaceae bacterium]|nr:tetratricopeptide repeat protein [Pyrinomonadaceae bacterium]